MQTLTVDLGDRSYSIYIGAGLYSDAELLGRHVRAGQVMLVSNETVAPLYLGRVQQQLQQFQCDVTLLRDGEQFKTLEELNKIFDSLMAAGHNRTSTIMALGGGVVGDMAGFAAASYQRGIEFIQLPTTLLAQVDSSVGGKTGVNHSKGKNMIGAFHQPKAVLIDTDTLKTLPPREFAAGFAEVIKYGLIADEGFYQWIIANRAAVFERDTAALTEAIYRSCQCKAEVVAADEKEAGIRAILNLGHTFGHAIETHTRYRELLHGEAVAVGMLMAAQMSANLGWLESSDVEQLQNLLEQCGLPVSVPAGMNGEDFLRWMAVDKKVVDGNLRLILLDRIGFARVCDVGEDFTATDLDAVLAEFCTHS